jgi:hypothetical protein
VMLNSEGLYAPKKAASSRVQPEPYYEAMVSVDGDKSVTVDYHSEAEAIASAVVVGAKIAAGILIIAGPLLFVTFVCVPCGVALAALAATTFAIDLIPGTDGRATGVLDMLNPMSIVQCGAKWGANTPTVNPNPPPLPPTTDAANEALLVQRSIELAREEPEFLAELSDEMRAAGLMPENDGDLTVAKLEVMSQKVGFAVTLAKRGDFFRKLGTTAYKARWGTRAMRLSNGYKDLTKAKTAFGKGMAVAAFASELYSAGYFSPDLVGNNEGYQDVGDLRGTSDFMDCMADKYASGISTFGLDAL